MATTTDWLPTRKSDQLVMFQNVRAKSDIYETVLPLTTAQIERINLICDIFVNAYTFTAQAKSAMEGVTTWRDNIFNDDYVGVMLDTFNDQRKAFEVFFNPLGIQGDGMLTEGRGEDFSVDLLLESKGIVHETGFNVEIAIPFKSLRFEAGKGKLWGAH